MYVFFSGAVYFSVVLLGHHKSNVLFEWKMSVSFLFFVLRFRLNPTSWPNFDFATRRRQHWCARNTNMSAELLTLCLSVPFRRFRFCIMQHLCFIIFFGRWIAFGCHRPKRWSKNAAPNESENDEMAQTRRVWEVVQTPQSWIQSSINRTLVLYRKVPRP